jgi:hypothetical protein
MSSLLFEFLIEIDFGSWSQIVTVMEMLTAIYLFGVSTRAHL